MQVDWYEELEWVGEYRFPLQKRNQNYTTLMTEWIHGYCSHIENCKSLSEKTKERVVAFANNLLECHARYLNSQFADAYTLFNQAMDEVQDALLSADFGMADNYSNVSVSCYYRIRCEDKPKKYLEMLHIPLANRKLAASGRFSAPGMPCSYLASEKEICWYECGMPCVFQLAKFKVKKFSGEHPKLLRLDLNPLCVKHDLPLLYKRKDIGDESMRKISEQVFFVLPLIAMCSVSARKSDCNFIEEYVIPQILMTWVRNSSTFVGVRYYSDSYNSLARNNCGHNIAIPVKDEDNNGYSSEICSLFNFSESDESKTFDMSDILQNKFRDDIANLELFLEEITYEKQHFTSTDPAISCATVEIYSEICSICEVLISLLSDYSESKGKSSYATVLTLAELQNWGKLLKERISNQQGKYDEIATEKIKKFDEKIVGFLDSLSTFFKLSITWEN